MRFSIIRSTIAAVTFASLVYLCVPVVSAQETDSTSRAPVRDAKRVEDAARHSRDAAKVFTEIMGAPDKGIPKELFDKAEAVGVFPGILKAGFIIGGRGGQGVIARRVSGGWSAPAFFNVGGASFGAQIGAEKIDAVFLFMNEGAVASLMKDKVELGGELSATAGPVGRTASASTDALLRAGILSYSRTKGLFAGAILKGAAITPDNDLNEAVYGMKAREILTGSEKMTLSTTPSEVRIFPETLARYSQRYRENVFVYRTLRVARTCVISQQRDRLAELVAAPQLTPSLILLSLLFAVVLEAFRTFTGTRKTIVGAYLVGSRGTARHAAFLGLTVTITHTAGVFALGVATLLASRYVVPERLFPVLSFLSGAIFSMARQARLQDLAIGAMWCPNYP
jgi:lipid-binding SYLF domain-containing protein